MAYPGHDPTACLAHSLRWAGSVLYATPSIDLTVPRQPLYHEGGAFPGRAEPHPLPGTLTEKNINAFSIPVLANHNIMQAT